MKSILHRQGESLESFLGVVRSTSNSTWSNKQTNKKIKPLISLFESSQSTASGPSRPLWSALRTSLLKPSVSLVPWPHCLSLGSSPYLPCLVLSFSLGSTSLGNHIISFTTSLDRPFLSDLFKSSLSFLPSQAHPHYSIIFSLWHLLSPQLLQSHFYTSLFVPHARMEMSSLWGSFFLLCI